MYKFNTKNKKIFKEDLVIINVSVYFMYEQNELHSFLIDFTHNLITDLGNIYDLSETPEDALIYRDLVNYGEGAWAFVKSLNEFTTYLKIDTSSLLKNGVKSLDTSISVDKEFDTNLLSEVAIESCFSDVEDEDVEQIMGSYKLERIKTKKRR